MTTPSDLAGNVKLKVGNIKSPGKYSEIENILNNNGRGSESVENIITKLDQFFQKSAPDKKDLLKYFEIYSSKGWPNWMADNKSAITYSDKDKPDELKSGTCIKKIVSLEDNTNLDVLIFSSRSDLFNPGVKNTKKVQVFLNNMPSTIVSQLIPYLDVEFQLPANQGTTLSEMGQLRFLLGDAKVDEKSINGILSKSQRVKEGDINKWDYSGMEMFTSPQTLVNPSQKINNGYTEINDPYRPFASIETLSLTSEQGPHLTAFRKAQLTIKLHDKSRLSQISDLIRPSSFAERGATVWLTYGWLAPKNSEKNSGVVTYFDYINNNFLSREAYGIMNSSLSFDQLGQVTIILDLYIKGSQEMLMQPVTYMLDKDKKGSKFTMETIKKIADEILRLRKNLKLDPPDHVSKEVRAFQVLESASQGKIPENLKTLKEDVVKLQEYVTKSGKYDVNIVNNLISKIDELYKKDKNKQTLHEKYKSQVNFEINNAFREVQTTPDPFLIDIQQKVANDQNKLNLFNEIKKFQNKPDKKKESWEKRYVSLGKIFSSFIVKCFSASVPVDELQIYFYAFNSECGPISGNSIANFPIDMTIFKDQYEKHVISTGDQNMTIDSFFSLLINAQVLDDRAIAYGFTQYYDPYSPTEEGPKLKKLSNKEAKAKEDKVAVFKKPAIELQIETVHQKASEGEADILKNLSYSARDYEAVTNNQKKQLKSKRILKIHVYDKQNNPYGEESRFLKGDKGYVVYDDKVELSSDKLQTIKDALAKENVNVKVKEQGIEYVQFKNGKQIKDLISKLVPTITYGANGTTVLEASVSSKADALMASANLMRANSTKNTGAPNSSENLGLPLRVIPAQLTMRTLGCPLAERGQFYFIDFNTGTTIDNVYLCTGLTHTIAQGKYETSWTFAFSDSYGVFENAPGIDDALESKKLEPKTK